MITIKDEWVVDNDYIPPKGSNVVRKEINTRNGEVRFLREELRKVEVSKSTSPFMDRLKDYVFLSLNPLMWLASMIGYFIHYIMPLAFILGIYKFPDELTTPIFLSITLIMVVSLFTSLFSKKYQEAIVVIWSMVVYMSILLIAGFIAVYPLYLYIIN